MASISPREIGLLLDLPDDVVDALIASGRLLCHVRNGETLVPLDQLEAFFRDGLIRVIRASAMPVQPLAAPQPQPEPPPKIEDVREVPPLAAAPEPEQEPEPEAELQMVIRPPVEEKRKESRIAPRFIPRRQIGGMFKDVKFSIVHISASGLRIRHSDPLIPGDEAKLSVALLNPPRSIVSRARVGWTSVAHYENDARNTFAISGLRVVEHAERLKNAIDILQQHHELQPEPLQPSSMPSAVSDDEVALVMQAAEKFASDPAEATRWYSRGRFALADEHVRRNVPPKVRDREQVLGIWEYLDRQVEIPKIAGVLTWMQRATGALPSPQ